jgi:hypothetical protein
MTSELLELYQANQIPLQDCCEVIRNKSPSINREGDAIDLIAIVISVLFFSISLLKCAEPIIHLQISLCDSAHAISFPTLGIDAIA